MPGRVGNTHNQGMTSHVHGQSLSSALVLPAAPDVPTWVDRALYPFVPKRFTGADGVPLITDHGSTSMATWSDEGHVLIVVSKTGRKNLEALL